MKQYIGKFQVHNLRLAIVVSRFNEAITKELLEGALGGLERYGVPREQVTVAWVPGAYEIPLIAKRCAASGQFDSVVCLGAVIRGATPHFDYVAGQASSGIMQVGLETGVPTIFGVITVDTLEQALERSGIKLSNKGYEAIQTAIEMVDLLRQLETLPKGEERPTPKKLGQVLGVDRATCTHK